MASFNKFNQFVEDLANGVHNLGSDTLKVYLSNTAPDAAADAVKADLAEITNQNGYTAPVTVTVDSSTESSGTYTLAVTTDIVVTATGAVGPFRYVVLYNDTPTSPADPLIGWWDYASSISLADTETFTIDFTASILTIA
jgi:hypothetical protein